MNRQIPTAIALLAAAGITGGALYAAGVGHEDEIVQLDETLTPTFSSESPTPIAMPLSLPMELPPATDGYTWWEIHAIEQFDMPGYAVEVPSDWIGSGVGGNPTMFTKEGANQASPRLFTRVTAEDLGYPHPILNLLPMSGSVCPESWTSVEQPPAEQITGNYTWDVYYFGCSTRVSAVGYERGERPVPYDVRGAEVHVGDDIFTVATFEPPGSGTSKNAFEQAVRSFRQRAATVSVSPIELPTSAAGYTWFEATRNSFWTALFDVQIPIVWNRDYGVFAPLDAVITSPYEVLPQLSFEVSVADTQLPDAHPWWHSPIRDYGNMDGFTCTGDVSGQEITPSGQFDSATYRWDTYRFTCHHVEPCCPEGISYDVRAAETHVGNVIISVVALEPVNSGQTEAAFAQALESLIVR